MVAAKAASQPPVTAAALKSAAIVAVPRAGGIVAATWISGFTRLLLGFVQEAFTRHVARTPALLMTRGTTNDFPEVIVCTRALVQTFICVGIRIAMAIGSVLEYPRVCYSEACGYEDSFTARTVRHASIATSASLPARHPFSTN